MNTPQSHKLDVKSVIVGVVLAIGGVVLLGADEPKTLSPKILSPRFLVLESSPQGEPKNGYQAHLLKLGRHYGKIETASLKQRLETETQEMKLILLVETGTEFKRGDLISFDSLRLFKLGSGSSITRHLPSGGQEQVP